MQRFLFKSKLFFKLFINTAIQIGCLLFFGWLEDKMLEMTIIWFCFFVFRANFEKQYHATTTWLCTLYSVLIFYIVSLITPNKDLSIVLIVLFTYLINTMSFYVREYLDLKARILKLNEVKIAKGMSKDELLKLTTAVGLNDLEVNILVSFYCERKSIQSIAYHTNYSYDRIWQLKNEALKKIKNKVSLK